MSTITTTQLQQQYIAYFGRPGDPAGIQYWLDSGITESEFAASIHAQDEYQTSTVGSKSTADQIDSLYQNLFGRSADPAGLIYWTVEVDAGRKSLSDLAVDLIYSTENPSEGNEEQAAADKAVLDAKVASAELFTADINADTDLIKAYQAESTGSSFVAGNALDSAKTWLAGITTTAATAEEVDAAVANVLTANDPVVVVVPTYSVATDVATVSEGNTVTSTVSTTNVAEGTTLYWSVGGTGVTATDFANGGALTGSGTVGSDGSLSFSHTIASDFSIEGTERLSIQVFSDANRTSQVGTTIEVSVTDVVPTYTLSTDKSTANEGDTVTSTVATTNVAEGTTLYWSVGGTGVSSSDFSAGALTGSANVDSDGNISFAHTLANDISTEGSETLSLRVFSDSNRTTQVGSTVEVAVGDTSVDPSYTLSTDKSTANEGDTVTSTVATTNVAEGTTLYWSVSGTGVSGTDFSAGALTGSGNVGSDGSLSFAHTLASDASTEGAETLSLRVFSDSNRTNQVGSTVEVSVADTSLDPTYTVSTDVSTVNEGSTLTSTVATTNVAEGTTIYWAVSGTNIAAADFDPAVLNGSATVGADGNATFAQVLASDSLTEGTETLSLKVYSDANRTTQVGTTVDVSIADTTPDNVELTTGDDDFTGTAFNDTYTASETTLGAADIIDGEGGSTDRLRYSSTGGVAVAESGFQTSEVEVYDLTSTATGGTNVNMSGADNVTAIINRISTTNLAVQRIKALTTVDLIGVSAGNTTISYDDDVLTGTADTLTLSLNNNITTANGAIGVVTVGDTTGDGFETVNVDSSTAASQLTGLATGAATINVTGNANLSTGPNALVNATTVNASTFTGDLDVVLDSAGTGRDVVVTGGTGNDTADFSAGFEAGDSFTGGDGTTDTVVFTQALASGALGGALSTVEQVRISTAGTGSIDMDDFAGVTRVIYDAGITAAGTATVDDLVSNLTIEVDSANANANLVAILGTDGTSDIVNFDIDEVGAGEGLAALTAATAETINIDIDDNTADGTGTFTITNLTATQATTISLTSDAAVTITGTTDPATPVLSTFNAGGMTDNLTISGTNFAAGGATVTLGSGDDVFNVATMSGGDTFNISAGGNDRIVYTAVAQSSQGVAGRSNVDTFTGFASGSDDIDLRTFVNPIVTQDQFLGNFTDFSTTQGALTGVDAGGIAQIQAVFQQDTNTLWVDNNGDQQLDGRDFRVVLSGVSTIAATDLALAGGVTATSTAAAFTATNTATNVSAALTNEPDVLNTTVAHLLGSTVNGQGGNDTINITGTGAIDLSPVVAVAATSGSITDVETMTLGAAVTGVTVAAADTGGGELLTIAGQTGTAQTLTLATTGDDLRPLSLRRIETVTFADANAAIAANMDTDNFTNITALNFGAGGGTADTLTLEAGTYDLTPTAVAFGDAGSTLNLSTGSIALTAQAADIANLTTINGNATDGTNTSLTFSDATNLSGVTNFSEIDTLAMTGANTTLTMDGDDITTLVSDDAATTLTFTGSGTSNLVLTAGDAAANLDITGVEIAGFDSINVDAHATTNTLTIDAASIAGETVLSANAGTNLAISQTGDYRNITATAADFDSLIITDGVTATVDESTLDVDATAGSILAIDSSGAAGANLAINMVGTSLNLGLITIGAAGGAANSVDTAVTGTTGNDTITAYDDSNPGSQLTIDGNGGNDVIRLENGSGNDVTAAGFTAGLANTVIINNFDATNDTISFATSDIAVASAGSAVKDAWNSTAGDGFAFITNTQNPNFHNEAAFYSAIGDVTIGNAASAAVALPNLSGSQVGIYHLVAAGGAIADAAMNTGDTVTLVALVNVTNGTFSGTNLGVHA